MSIDDLYKMSGIDKKINMKNAPRLTSNKSAALKGALESFDTSEPERFSHTDEDIPVIKEMSFARELNEERPVIAPKKAEVKPSRDLSIYKEEAEGQEIVETKMQVIHKHTLYTARSMRIEDEDFQELIQFVNMLTSQRRNAHRRLKRAGESKGLPKEYINYNGVLRTLVPYFLEKVRARKWKNIEIESEEDVAVLVRNILES